MINISATLYWPHQAPITKMQAIGNGYNLNQNNYYLFKEVFSNLLCLSYQLGNDKLLINWQMF